MLVIDNEDGTWNVVYNVRDPDRVWQDDEDEEEDVAVDRLVMAKNQELQPSHKAQQPGKLEQPPSTPPTRCAPDRVAPAILQASRLAPSTPLLVPASSPAAARLSAR